MHEKLIEYLLGSLEQEEVQNVEDLIKNSNEAREQLESLRLCLAAMQADREQLEDPADLIQRTCQRVRDLRLPPRARA